VAEEVSSQAVTRWFGKRRTIEKVSPQTAKKADQLNKTAV
jgi:hypothetical protein